MPPVYGEWSTSKLEEKEADLCGLSTNEACATLAKSYSKRTIYGTAQVQGNIQTRLRRVSKASCTRFERVLLASRTRLERVLLASRTKQKGRGR